SQHQCCERHLRHGVELRHHQRFHRYRLVEQPRHDHGHDDHDVARHHEDDEPARNRAPDAERDEDRHQQRLVGERVEQGAQLARHVEPLGEKAVDGVADAGNDEDREGDFHLAGNDRPDDDRHQDDAAQRNDIRNAQLGRFPGSRPQSGPWRVLPVLIYIVYAPSACEPLQDRGIPRNQPSSYWNLGMNDRKNGLTYADSGVDIDAGNRLVDLIKPMVRATARAGADAEIGGFGGLFDLKAAGFKDPVLVAATDGVGTKVKIAIETGLHAGIGIDLVAMSVNDLVVQGAEPLFFLDYFACGKLDPDAVAAIIAGVAEGCRGSGCALIGGETAEMPGLYKDGDYDLAGFAVGAAERGTLLPRADIAVGDAVIGLASSGVHSNGFSLVRKVVETSGLGFDSQAPFSPFMTLGGALLIPTRLYVKSCLRAIRETE